MRKIAKWRLQHNSKRDVVPCWWVSPLWRQWQISWRYYLWFPPDSSTCSCWGFKAKLKAQKWKHSSACLYNNSTLVLFLNMREYCGTFLAWVVLSRSVPAGMCFANFSFSLFFQSLVSFFSSCFPAAHLWAYAPQTLITDKGRAQILHSDCVKWQTVWMRENKISS